MKRRYLIISMEEKLRSGKINTYHHFDIIISNNIDNALKLLKSVRPKIKSYTHLSHNEINKIHTAMNFKSDKAIEKKFKENTSGKS